MVLDIGRAMVNMEYKKTHLPYLKEAYEAFAPDGRVIDTHVKPEELMDKLSTAMGILTATQ